jgi:tetratricopeptide (TPR) repeat protein
MLQRRSFIQGIFLSLVFKNFAWATPLELDLEKLSRNLKVVQVHLLDENALSSMSPVTKMKWFESKMDWKKCADFRESALKASPTISGWIWTIAFSCELRLLDQGNIKVKITDSSKESTKIIEPSISKKWSRLKAFVSKFQSHLDLLDRGPWKKELQNYWLQSLTSLRVNSNSLESKNQITEYYFHRPELISNDLEKGLLTDLQVDSFVETKSSSISVQRSQNQSSEPWVELARKLEYEKVISMLEDYFDKNKSPSNELSGKLLLGKAYLWTGRYEEAKTTFSHLAENNFDSEEGIEAQFRLGCNFGWAILSLLFRHLINFCNLGEIKIL